MTALDFYTNERGLASYFEGAWLSLLHESKQVSGLSSVSGEIPYNYVNCGFYGEFIQLVEEALKSLGFAPRSLLDIGTALGRNCYEAVQLFDSIEHVTVVEPSEIFMRSFQKLFLEAGPHSFPYVYSLADLRYIDLDTNGIFESCSHVNFDCIQAPMDKQSVSSEHDLVYCLNVLDQCSNPTEIVEAAMASTKQGGILAMSCSYQWSKKHLMNFDEVVNNINCYFNDSWELVREAEIDYKFRFNERFSQSFLCHTVLYRKR